MKREYDEDDDYGPPPKKSSVSVMLIVGIILGAGLLLVLAVVVCGGAWFMARVDAPDQPPAVRQENGAVNDAPVTKPTPAPDKQPEGMKAKAKQGDAKPPD